MQTEEILNQDGIQLINDIRANLGSSGQNATLETSQSLRIEVKQEGTKFKLSLFGRPYFMTVQTGRKPTPDKKPSREMIDRITRWVEARDIDISAVWGIATNIQKKGTKLWQTGGRTDIVDPAVDDFINNVANDLLDSAADDFQMKIRQMKWQ
jgi:hypothetical protein